MSRANPLEVCAFCERFFPSSQMSTKYAKDPDGKTVALRVCRSCLHFQLTYIQGLTPRGGHASLAALIIAILYVTFGLIMPPPWSFILILIGALIGAGTLAWKRVSCIQKSS